MDALDGDEIYSAERLLDERTRAGKQEYLVKWKGWSVKQSTWEPARNVLDKRLVDEFEERRSASAHLKIGTPPSGGGPKRKSGSSITPKSRNASPIKTPLSSPKRTRRSNNEEFSLPSTSAGSHQSNEPKEVKISRSNPTSPAATTTDSTTKKRGKTSSAHSKAKASDNFDVNLLTDGAYQAAKFKYLETKARHDQECYEAELAVVKLQEKKLRIQIENAKELQHQLHALANSKPKTN